MSVSSSGTLSENCCVICRTDLTGHLNDKDISTVRAGLPTLIEYSEKYQHYALHTYLLSKPSVVRVHNSCRSNYTSKRKYEQTTSKSDATDDDPATKCLRSSVDVKFDWNIHCFLCGKLCVIDVLHPSRCRISKVETDKEKIDKKIKDQCLLRNDSWGIEVLGRMNTCNDLFSENAVYHANCRTDFFRKVTFASAGRPVDVEKDKIFETLCEWLEMNECELVTIEDLITKAMLISNDSNHVYSGKRIKQKLQERYGEHIQFAEVCGRKNVVCWREMAHYIINEEWYKNRKENFCDENNRIIVTAAKLLKAAIRESEYTMDS